LAIVSRRAGLGTAEEVAILALFIASDEAILVEAKVNASWSADFVHDQFAAGRRLRRHRGEPTYPRLLASRHRPVSAKSTLMTKCRSRA